MSSATPGLSSANPPTADPRPTAFIVGAFVLASIVGGAVLWIGLSGDFPGTIPGSHIGTGAGPPPTPASCEGKDLLGNATFSFIAGGGGGFWFNGTHPGPCVAVVVGSSITVDFSVADDAGQNHSWVLVNASNASTALSTPAFPGAGFTGGARFMGIEPGSSTVFHFNATVVGSYQYICEMTGHYGKGMWGWFNVTSVPTPVPSSHVEGALLGVAGFAAPAVPSARRQVPGDDEGRTRGA
jgi:hypothetical protein